MSDRGPYIDGCQCQAAAKAAYTTRRVDLSAARCLTLVSGIDVTPQAGDLVLARVAEIGQHKRYAPDQFEAEVPADLSSCQLVAGGGLAARVVTAHLDMDDATGIVPIGLIADSTGRVLNVRDGALIPRAGGQTRPLTFVVAGTSMNSGKTTTVAAIAHGLTAAGLRVGATKVIGTGAGGVRPGPGQSPRRHQGDARRRALGVNLPLWVYRLPLVGRLQDWVYAAVARNRRRLRGVTPWCVSHPEARCSPD